MNVMIKSIPVGIGDCFFLCLNRGEESYNIMVDCHQYNDDVKKMVEGTLHKHINLLIVTHIDFDHVLGVTEMINSVDGLIIDEIWFNSYQREPLTPAQVMTEEQKERLMELKENLPFVVDALATKVDANDAMLLSEAILKYEAKIGKKVWLRDYITTGIADKPLGKQAEWGSIHVVGPDASVIEELDIEFKKVFMNLFYDKHNMPIIGDESIYELMMHYLEQKEKVLTMTDEGAKNADATFSLEGFLKDKNKEVKEKRLENKASIAFVWSSGGHKILFAGDSDHKQLYDQINKDYADKLPLIFDAIKVSHHGSSTGTSNILMQIIDSGEYFIPCGTNKVPSTPTMAKILDRELPEVIGVRKIHYNYATSKIAELLSNVSAMESLPKYKLTDEHEYKFTC